MYLIRHSERLDFVIPEEWEKNPRYKEHNIDPPITVNGGIIATNKIKIIIDNDFRLVQFIYSSPADRCLQTSRIFQNYILTTYKKLIPIRIENGLIWHTYGDATSWLSGNSHVVIENNKFVMKRPQLTIDSQMV